MWMCPRLPIGRGTAKDGVRETAPEEGYVFSIFQAHHTGLHIAIRTRNAGLVPVKPVIVRKLHNRIVSLGTSGDALRRREVHGQHPCAVRKDNDGISHKGAGLIEENAWPAPGFAV